jgi:hypothetical protein
MNTTVKSSNGAKFAKKDTATIAVSRHSRMETWIARDVEGHCYHGSFKRRRLYEERTRC